METFKSIKEKRWGKLLIMQWSHDDKQLCLIRTVIRQQKGFGGKTFIKNLKKRFRVDFEVRKRGRPVKKKK